MRLEGVCQVCPRLSSKQREKPRTKKETRPSSDRQLKPCLEKCATKEILFRRGSPLCTGDLIWHTMQTARKFLTPPWYIGWLPTQNSRDNVPTLRTGVWASKPEIKTSEVEHRKLDEGHDSFEVQSLYCDSFNGFIFLEFEGFFWQEPQVYTHIFLLFKAYAPSHIVVGLMPLVRRTEKKLHCFSAGSAWSTPLSRCTSRSYVRSGHSVRPAPTGPSGSDDPR